jgi:hypothetical protein
VVPLVAAPAVLLPQRRFEDRVIFGGADDPPWAGQLSARQSRAAPRAQPLPYWLGGELPRASFPAETPYAPPTFQIIGAPSSRNMQEPVKLTHGVKAPPRMNPEPRIIWLDRNGKVADAGRDAHNPHVHYIK